MVLSGLFNLRFGLSSGSRTFTHFNEFEKCRLEFGQSLTNIKEFVKLYSMHLSKLQGKAAPPIQSHSFLAVK